MIDVADDPGFAPTLNALPVGAFPLLEAMYPRDSCDSEKAAVIVALLQMALQSEDDV